jgi:uncharacterized GH25 family protein
MKRLWSVALLLAAAAPARAHFVWLLPAEPGAKEPGVRLVFSDGLEPDKPELLKKVAHTKLFARGADGKEVAVKAAEGKDALQVALPDGKLYEVAGVCRYGVTQRGSTEPFLLNYYPKAFAGQGQQRGPVAFLQPWPKLPLEIVPVLDAAGPAVRVFWQGEPLAGAEVALLVPGVDKPVEGKTDAGGTFMLKEQQKAGLYGVRARHTEKKAGELDGKKYTEVRHYATLVLRVPAPAAARGAGAAATQEKPAADPAATKLLADARAARATWENFPGFSADVAVNLDGKVTRGQVEVSAKGEVALKLEKGAAAEWARPTLRSIVGHRLDNSADLDTPCAFADDNAQHPLGRAVRVLNDEFHSSYRIRDRQVIVVNRSLRDTRFTITVLENRQSAEKKFLPVSYVVNTWAAEGGALRSAAAHHQTWQRVGRFDLPQTATVVTASAGKLEARSLTLSNFRLSGGDKVTR